MLLNIWTHFLTQMKTKNVMFTANINSICSIFIYRNQSTNKQTQINKEILNLPRRALFIPFLFALTQVTHPYFLLIGWGAGARERPRNCQTSSALRESTSLLSQRARGTYISLRAEVSLHQYISPLQILNVLWFVVVFF